MIVAVDARSLTAGRGVSRYAREMLGALARAFPGDAQQLVAPRFKRAVFGASALIGAPTLTALGGRGADVAWLPAPGPVRVGDLPYVLTVHDLSWVERPRDFTAYERAWHAVGRLPHQARRAARVVADSRATARVLAERWGVEAVVVAPGVTRPAGPPGANRRGRYLLAVGALEPRKAPEVLLGAFARARARGLDAELVVAGTGRRAPALAGRPGVTLLGAIGDAELDALYAHAVALVHPAWLEGYGLPPLEALVRGTPSVVADLPVYDETLGAGALRFPPGDAAALADALLRVEAERDRLLAAAPQPPTWDDAAAALRAVLAGAAAR
jgi:glycosyltransferase involved in cell wall biosynthesis